MEKLLELLLATYVLFVNLKSYKFLFRSDSKDAEVFENSLAVLKKDIPEIYKGLSIIFGTLFLLPSFIFYIICALTFTNVPLLLAFSVLKLTLLIVWWVNIFKIAITNKRKKRGLLNRILVPLTTLYVGYFIWFVLNH